MRTRSSQHLVVSLHDVSPKTRADCTRILREMRTWGVKKCSLLVIPDHHRSGHFLQDSAFCAWLREQAKAGHEIVIHGYTHQRARRGGEGLAARLTTEVYTADEGEFYDLDRASAHALVAQARVEFRQVGVAPTGFIAPAWLLSKEAENALRDLGIEYTTRLGSVVDLQKSRAYRSQSLVWSVRSLWRRVTSLAWNALLFRLLAHHGLMRLSIHPVDFHHPAVRRQIRSLIARAIAVREPLTYAAWIESQRRSLPSA